MPSTLRLNRDLAQISFAIFTWGVGESMFYIFQPIYLQQWGASPVQIGAILGAVGVAQSIMQIPSGYISDKIGPRPILWTAWIIGLLATVLMAWAGTMPVFVAGMILYGTTMFVNPALSSFYMRVRGSLSVERVLTIVAAVYNLGAVIGPLIGGFIASRSGLQSVYRFSAAIFVVSAMAIFTLRKPASEPTHSSDHQNGSVPLLRNTRYLQFLGLTFFALFALYLSQPLTPNFLQNQRGYSLDAIGQMGSLANLSNAVIMLLFGGLPARGGIIIGHALMAIYAVLLWRGENPLFISLAYSLAGGFRLARMMIMAFGRSLVHSRHTGLAFGILETISALTMVAAPLLAGYLYDREPGSMYSTSLILIAVSLLVGLIFFYRRSPQISKITAGESP